MKSGRRPEPRIKDVRTHPRERVGLKVAALYLGMAERTLIARIDEGRLPAVHDGRVWQITLADLARYEAERRARPS